MKTMKTKYFLTSIIEEEEKKEFLVIQEASDNTFEKVFQWFFNNKEFPEISGRATKNLVIETDELPETIKDIVIGFYRLIQVFRDDENTVNDFISDIKNCCDETIIDETKFRNRLNKISTLSNKYDLSFKIKDTTSLGPSALRNSSVSVVLKPVIDKRFNSKEDKIEEYKPNILKYVPNILFELETKDYDKLAFQMEPDDFERFLNNLIAIQLELKYVKDDFRKK